MNSKETRAKIIVGLVSGSVGILAGVLSAGVWIGSISTKLDSVNEKIEAHINKPDLHVNVLQTLRSIEGRLGRIEDHWDDEQARRKR